MNDIVALLEAWYAANLGAEPQRTNPAYTIWRSETYGTTLFVVVLQIGYEPNVKVVSNYANSAANSQDALEVVKRSIARWNAGQFDGDEFPFMPPL